MAFLHLADQILVAACLGKSLMSGPVSLSRISETGLIQRHLSQNQGYFDDEEPFPHSDMGR